MNSLSSTAVDHTVAAGGAAGAISRAMHGVDRLATIVAAGALLIELAVVLVGVIGRTLLGHGPLWSDEASRLALAIIAFIGGAAAYRGAHHTAIRLITDRLGDTAREPIGAGIEWLVVIVTATAAWQSVALLKASWGNVTPILQISTGWITLPGDVRPAADRAVRTGAPAGRIFLAYGDGHRRGHGALHHACGDRGWRTRCSPTIPVRR